MSESATTLPTTHFIAFYGQIFGLSAPGLLRSWERLERHRRLSFDPPEEHSCFRPHRLCRSRMIRPKGTIFHFAHLAKKTTNEQRRFARCCFNSFKVF